MQLVRSSLRHPSDGRQIAHFDGEFWQDGAEESVRIEIAGPLEVLCVDGELQAKLGRFDSLALEGPLLNSPAGTLGKLTQKSWEVLASGIHWPVLWRAAAPIGDSSAESNSRRERASN
jgi:hypothetical protein